MQKTETLEELKNRGQDMASRDQPLEAWRGQQSTKDERFHVIFDGNVYFNTQWVDAGQCPGDSSDTDTNPWKLEREATQQEMVRLGNPTSDVILDEQPLPLKH